MYRLYLIKDFFRYDLPYGIRNLIVWFPLVWRDRDWDWAYLARIMEFKLQKMSAALEKGDTYVGVERDVRDMRVCSRLLRLILEDDYQGPYEKEAYAAHEAKMVKSQRLLGKIIGKRLRCWWD